MERNDQPPPNGTPSVMAARTRTCPMCNGAKGAMKDGTEMRGGQRIATQTWKDCRRCSGAGEVSA